MKELSAALAVLQEQVVDAGGEYANVKGFGQVTVRSGFVAGRMGVVRGLCREDDDGNMASGQVVLLGRVSVRLCQASSGHTPSGLYFGLGAERMPVLRRGLL